MAADELAGTTTTVWISRDGQVASAPLSPRQAASQAIVAAAVAAALLALLLAAVSRAVSLVLDRHRLARWEADWSVTGPQWTGRHGAPNVGLRIRARALQLVTRHQASRRSYDRAMDNKL